MIKVSVICGMSYLFLMKQKSVKIKQMFNRLRALINRSMLWKVKYSNILDEEKFIYYPYLDDMGHVTDPYLLWYNEFKAAGKDVDTYLGAEITE
nr:MAG TPA: hypothetical protein [Caudoviricetes sp.]